MKYAPRLGFCVCIIVVALVVPSSASAQDESATQQLARIIVRGGQSQPIPPVVAEQARRMMINAVAVGVSATCMEPFDRILKWAEMEGAHPRSSILSRTTRSSPSLAALVNGFAFHLQDYDDTHSESLIHPTAPVLPVVLALSESVGASEEQALRAFVFGAEVACRMAMSVTPEHYDAGWHITSTAGVFGSVAAASIFLELSEEEVVFALGIGGTTAAGVREVFGSNVKAFHPGMAARNGVQAAQLAAIGFNGPADIVGGRRGFWEVLSPDGIHPEELLADFGNRWEILDVGLKAYSNGQVVQPVQDGVIQLRNEYDLVSSQVVEISIRCNPILVELMDNANPTTGLEGKFSFQHCAAVGLIDGAGYEAQFSDERVNDAEVAALRQRVFAEPSDDVLETEVYVTITLNTGAPPLTRYIEHATGTPQNPMSDEFLENKFTDLVMPVLGSSQGAELLRRLRTLGGQSAMSEVVKLLTSSNPQCEA